MVFLYSSSLKGDLSSRIGFSGGDADGLLVSLERRFLNQFAMVVIGVRGDRWSYAVSHKASVMPNSIRMMAKPTVPPSRSLLGGPLCPLHRQHFDVALGCPHCVHSPASRRRWYFS